jgi:hypothetical protein
MQNNEQGLNASQIEKIRHEIAKSTPSSRRRAFEKFFLAALGSIPWVGGFISAAAEFKLEERELDQDSLQSQWLDQHAIKLERLHSTLEEIAIRFENLGSEIDDRIQSEEYLDVVRRAFRAWDHADTDKKRKYVANLVANASGTQITTDDVIRLFIDWLDSYHEAHFAVIREIFQNPGCTRFEIWDSIHGSLPREDSAEADLFKMLIRDLSIGGVIRQERATTASGEFIKKSPRRRTGTARRTMESAFEDTKPYVLTDLGSQFVHYTMSEIVPRIDSENSEANDDIA